MKGKRLLCFAAALAAAFWPIRAFAAAPEISADSAVLVCRNNRETLFAKNENERRAIASTTKIMTALLTLEAAADGDRAVAVTEDMVRVEGSSMGLRAGERISLSGLAAGMLMVSGNDAANAAAVSVGGSAEQFAAMMNAKAASLGMNDTHFVTPSGLDDEEHYSTARDMAALACAALQNSAFAGLVRCSSVRISFLQPEETHTYRNHNRLLGLYPYCTGVKTGFTKKSGRCLVSSAEKDGVQLVAVTLSDPNDWDDHIALFNYGFSRLAGLTPDDSGFQLSAAVVGGVENTVSVRGTAGKPVVTEAGAELTRTVELPRFLYAPLAAGQTVGCVRYESGGRTVAVTELLAGEDVARAQMPGCWLQVLWNSLKLLLFGG